MNSERNKLIIKQSLPLIKSSALGYIQEKNNDFEYKIKEQRINDGCKAIEELIENYKELKELTDNLNEALDLASKDICKITKQPDYHWLTIKENYINQTKDTNK